MRKPALEKMSKRKATKLREQEENRKAELRDEVSYHLEQIKDMLNSNRISRTDYEIWKRVYESQLTD